SSFFPSSVALPTEALDRHSARMPAKGPGTGGDDNGESRRAEGQSREPLAVDEQDGDAGLPAGTARVVEWKKWLFGALGPGIRNGPPNSQGWPQAFSFDPSESALSRQNATRGAAELDFVVRARTRRGIQNRTKSSLLESSRRALQIALDRRI
ncbi:hypothetical protein THAOC_27119, partial [Thalassiosira oceanica]